MPCLEQKFVDGAAPGSGGRLQLLLVVGGGVVQRLVLAQLLQGNGVFLQLPAGVLPELFELVFLPGEAEPENLLEHPAEPEFHAPGLQGRSGQLHLPVSGQKSVILGLVGDHGGVDRVQFDLDPRGQGALDFACKFIGRGSLRRDEIEAVSVHLDDLRSGGVEELRQEVEDLAPLRRHLRGESVVVEAPLRKAQIPVKGPDPLWPLLPPCCV